MSGRGRSRGRGQRVETKTMNTGLGETVVTDVLAAGDSPALKSWLKRVEKSSGGGDVLEDKDVKQLAQRVDKQLRVCKAFTQKPNQLAKNGKEIDVIANHFKLELKDMTFFHYDIDIRLGNDSGLGFVSIAGPKEKKMRKLAQKENMEVIEKLTKEWPELFARKPYVFDGLKNLYTKDRLDLNGRQLSKNVMISLDGSNDQLFEVRIQFANEIQMSLNNDLNDGKVSDISDEAFHVLEIILRFKATGSRIPVGRSLYMKEQNRYTRERSGDKSSVMAFGHYQSVHMTEVGPTLVIDRTATLFRTSGPLKEFILNLMSNVRHRDINLIKFDEQLITRLSKQLSGIRISTTHVGGKRHSVIDSLSFLKPIECVFDINREGNKVQTNVLNYFKEQYSIELEFPDIPCIKLRGGVARYLPIEVCNVSADQPILSKHITPAMLATMCRSGQQRPEERFSFVEKTAKSIASESSDLLNDMIIKLSTEPIRLRARVLNKPLCSGSERRLYEPKMLLNWHLFCSSPLVELEMNGRVDDFIKALIKEGSVMGMTIKEPVIKQYFSNRGLDSMKEIFTKVDAMEAQNKPQLLVFCIPYGDGTYHWIKQLGDIKFGLMTVCVKVENLLNIPRGFLTNFLLKINGKLNGKNTILSLPERPIIMNELMVIGADVTHPAPADRMVSSVAAVIGSYDSDYSKFSASIRVQHKSKEEIITQFKEMIIELLMQYIKYNNNNWPKGLLLFRDGVSEGQFEHVLKYEYKQTVDACAVIHPNFKPKITFVVVQKRHHTRFMCANPCDGVGKASNIPPGTVVDKTIVHPILYEYYLCSHFGLIGTSRPSKYVVLHDDHKFSFDQMEQLSYYLCHTYIRTTKPISVPTPVMYSHLAAKRSKEHIIAENRKQLMNREAEERIAFNLNQKIKVNENLKNLLYYC